jgi:hypothetical protein
MAPYNSILTTKLTRFRVATDTLKFTDRIPPKVPEPVRDTSAIFERIATIHRENLQRLDDDMAVLSKYLKSEGASKDVFQALETLSNEQHASWRAAVERIEDLIGEKNRCAIKWDITPPAAHQSD